MSKRVSEYLMIGDVGGRNVMQCAKCEYVFCAATENYKNYALMGEFSPAKLGTVFKASNRFVIREFYCPQCGIMLDVEVQLKDQPYLWDAHLKTSFSE